MRGGPRSFHQGSTCLDVLWIPLRRSFLRLRGFHPLWLAFPKPFRWKSRSGPRSEPRHARIPVWALPLSLAATQGIDVSFSSSGYLDVSVHRVPLHILWIQIWIHGVSPCGSPHSDIRGSLDICSSPRLFAAYHVFLRLSVPRHPPCALFSLTSRPPWYSVTISDFSHALALCFLCRGFLPLPESLSGLVSLLSE